MMAGKMARIHWQITGALLSIIVPQGGATATEGQVRSLAAGALPAEADLANLRGLVGSWAGELGSVAFSAPAGGQMVGHLVLLKDSRTPFLQELWLIRPEGRSVLVFQKHYSADLKDREDKDIWTQRRVVNIDAGHIYLDNLTFVIKGDRLRLLARVPGAADAKQAIVTYTFNRVR